MRPRLHPLTSAAFVTLLAASGARAGGPTLAIEDTLRTSVSEVLVRAPRVTLDEILDRVARGEAHRESLMTDQTFTATSRLVVNTAGRGTPKLFAEEVDRVWRKRPDKVRTLQLRKYEAHPDKQGDDDAIHTDFSPNMGEQLVNFAFQPDARREYRYRIEDRTLLGDHLIYRIAFEPRSALDALEPSGEVWVDTKDFVIVRQEVSFRRSPVPVLLKGVDRMVVERRQVGPHWVLARMLARIELTVPLPGFGRSFDFALALDDYAINTGLPDSLFAGAGGRAADGRGGRR